MKGNKTQNNQNDLNYIYFSSDLWVIKFCFSFFKKLPLFLVLTFHSHLFRVPSKIGNPYSMLLKLLLKCRQKCQLDFWELKFKGRSSQNFLSKFLMFFVKKFVHSQTLSREKTFVPKMPQKNIDEIDTRSWGKDVSTCVIHVNHHPHDWTCVQVPSKFCLDIFVFF